MIVISKVVERKDEGDDRGYTYRAVWIQESKRARETICKKAEELGYTVDEQDNMSWHNYKYEMGVVIPNFDVSTPESKAKTIATIKEISQKLGLKDTYCKPNPILEEGGVERYRYRRFFDTNEK